MVEGDKLDLIEIYLVLKFYGWLVNDSRRVFDGECKINGGASSWDGEFKTLGGYVRTSSTLALKTSATSRKIKRLFLKS